MRNLGRAIFFLEIISQIACGFLAQADAQGIKTSAEVQPRGHGHCTLRLSTDDDQSDMAEIPILLEFTTDPNTSRYYSNDLPTGWRLPLLESVAIALNETEVMFQLPEGDTLTLSRLPPSTPGNNHTLHVDEAKRVVTLEWNKQHYTFERGRLVSWTNDLKSPSQGRNLQFKYDKEGRCTGIFTGKEPIIRISRDKAMGDSRLNISIVDKLRKPVTFAVSYFSLRGSNLDQSLLDAQLPDSGSIHQILANGKSLARLHLDKDENGRKRLEIEDCQSPVMVVWDESTGVLHSINDRLLRMTHPPAPSKYEEFLPRIESFEQGSWTLIQQARSESDWGAVIHGENGEQKFVFKGYVPNRGMVVRRIEQQMANGSKHPEYVAHYNSKGGLISDKSGPYTRRFDGQRYSVFKEGKLIRQY